MTKNQAAYSNKKLMLTKKKALSIAKISKNTLAAKQKQEVSKWQGARQR